MAKPALIKEIKQEEKRTLIYWEGKNSPDGVIDSALIKTAREAHEKRQLCDREYEKKGDYWNLVGITLTPGGEVESTEKKAEKPYQRGSLEERSSIEAQVAFKGAVELLVGKVITLGSSLGDTAISYAMSKLSNWASMGDVVPQEPHPELAQAYKDWAEEQEKIQGEVSWEDVRPMLAKRYDAKEKGWGTAAMIIEKMGKLGADPSSNKVDSVFETMSQEAKQKFLEMVRHG